MTTHTPSARRKIDAEESRIMAAMSAVDLVCLGAIRRVTEDLK